MICTRDIVANVYGPPVMVHHIGQAIRTFGDECRRKEPGNVLAQHPEDFELWHIGEFDDNTGSIDTYNPEDERRKQLAVGANYRDQ